MGWTVGRNLRIDYRLGADNSERVRWHVAEMVALAPDVILANGTSAVGPLLQATRTAPVVFVHLANSLRQYNAGTVWRFASAKLRESRALPWIGVV